MATRSARGGRMASVWSGLTQGARSAAAESASEASSASRACIGEVTSGPASESQLSFMCHQ
eukprot:scaffold209644_cov34-Tisochrysis_lutea.AAC.3